MERVSEECGPSGPLSAATSATQVLSARGGAPPSELYIAFLHLEPRIYQRPILMLLLYFYAQIEPFVELSCNRILPMLPLHLHTKHLNPHHKLPLAVRSHAPRLAQHLRPSIPLRPFARLLSDVRVCIVDLTLMSHNAFIPGYVVLLRVRTILMYLFP